MDIVSQFSVSLRLRRTPFIVAILGFFAISVAQDECVVLVDPNAGFVEEGVVCGTQGHKCSSIMDAIEALASENRTDCKLQLLPGVYRGTGNVNITEDALSKWSTIESIDGNENTIVDCEFHPETHAILFGDPSRGIDATPEIQTNRNFAISGITFRNCNGSVNSYGAVAAFQHNLRVQHSYFHDNTNMAFSNVAGGGLKSSKADYLHVSNCYFERNAAGIGGGLVASETKEVVIEHSHFYKNFATKYTGGMLIQYGERAYLKNVTFLDHTAIGPAAFHILQFLHTELVDVLVEDASATPVPWGAKHAVIVQLFDNNTPNTSLVMRNVRIINCDGGDQGAMRIGEFRDIEMSNCTFQGNVGETAAGALTIYSTGDTEGQEIVRMKLRIEDCHFDDNLVLGGYGGAIDITYKDVDSVNAKIVNSNFTGNVVSDYGGAISVHSESIDMTITGSVFSNNVAMDFEGGAIFFEENAGGDVGLTVQHSKFSNNSAMFGGSIFATIVEKADFEGNTFIRNYAEEKGGSVFGSGMTFENDEFVNSRAGGYGGGIYALRGEVKVQSSKFTACSANFGGGMAIGSRAVLDADELTCDSCHATADAACSGVSGYGGCIYFEDVSCYLSELTGTFEGNMADTTGGVFSFEDGNCEICDKDDCEFIDNVAPYGIEAGSYFTEVRLDKDAQSVPIIPGTYFTVLLHAFDAFGNQLAGRHALITAIADFESAKSGGLLIDGEHQVLFLNGTAELTLLPFLIEDAEVQKGSSKDTKASSKSSPSLLLEFDPPVEALEVILEFEDCGENQQLAPVVDEVHENADKRILTCSDVVVPTLVEQIGTWVVASFVLGILLFNTFALRYFKHYSQIRHGNRNALFLINISLIVMQIGAYFAATSEYCAVTVWLAGIGFSAASAFIVLKNGQIAMLFYFVYDKQMLNTKTKVIQPRYLYMLVSFIVAIDTIVLIVWTAADSPFYLFSDYQRFCVSDKASTYLSILLALKCALALLAFLIVLKLKRVPELFREVSATLLAVPIGLGAAGIAYWSYKVAIRANQPLVNSYIISMTVAILFILTFAEKWFLVHQNRYKTLGLKSAQLPHPRTSATSRASSAAGAGEQEQLLKDLKRLEVEVANLNKQLADKTAKHRVIKEQFFFSRLQAEEVDGDFWRVSGRSKGGFTSHSPRGSTLEFTKDRSGVAASQADDTIELSGDILGGEQKDDAEVHV